MSGVSRFLPITPEAQRIAARRRRNVPALSAVAAVQQMHNGCSNMMEKVGKSAVEESKKVAERLIEGVKLFTMERVCSAENLALNHINKLDQEVRDMFTGFRKFLLRTVLIKAATYDAEGIYNLMTEIVSREEVSDIALEHAKRVAVMQRGDYEKLTRAVHSRLDKVLEKLDEIVEAQKETDNNLYKTNYVVDILDAIVRPDREI